MCCEMQAPTTACSTSEEHGPIRTNRSAAARRSCFSLFHQQNPQPRYNTISFLSLPPYSPSSSPPLIYTTKKEKREKRE